MTRADSWRLVTVSGNAVSPSRLKDGSHAVLTQQSANLVRHPVNVRQYRETNSLLHHRLRRPGRSFSPPGWGNIRLQRLFAISQILFEITDILVEMSYLLLCSWSAFQWEFEFFFYKRRCCFCMLGGSKAQDNDLDGKRLKGYLWCIITVLKLFTFFGFIFSFNNFSTDLVTSLLLYLK